MIASRQDHDSIWVIEGPNRVTKPRSDALFAKTQFRI